MDRRSADEREQRRIEVQNSALQFISERKAAEQEQWKLKQAQYAPAGSVHMVADLSGGRAKQQAHKEWQQEELDRNSQLEQEVSSQLMQELADVTP